MKRIIALALILLIVAGCQATDNPSAKDILEGNPDADLIKLDGIIYSSNPQKDRDYTKGVQIGEIKKQTTNTWWYRNLYASQLPKGTAVYSTKDEYQDGDAPFVILVEVDGELVSYHALLEG
ncbi:lipoprotein [Piscibacillus sp. B03]|uniref:lipoprotein n=1 Tax=Piscibacillus sp. B03 TaxID=3457430 RepID=UPI003FCDF44F